MRILHTELFIEFNNKHFTSTSMSYSYLMHVIINFPS